MWRRQTITWQVLDLGPRYDAILGMEWIKEVDPIFLHRDETIMFRASLKTMAVVEGKKQIRRAAEEAAEVYTLALSAVTARRRDRPAPAPDKDNNSTSDPGAAPATAGLAPTLEGHGDPLVATVAKDEPPPASRIARRRLQRAERQALAKVERTEEEERVRERVTELARRRLHNEQRAAEQQGDQPDQKTQPAREGPAIAGLAPLLEGHVNPAMSSREPLGGELVDSIEAVPEPYREILRRIRAKKGKHLVVRQKVHAVDLEEGKEPPFRPIYLMAAKELAALQE